FANAQQTLALPGGVGIGPTVPGSPGSFVNNNRLIAVQDVHSFTPTLFNEARIGYSFIRNDAFPDEFFKDSDLGITRSNADAFPGLGVVRLAGPAPGSVIVGTVPLADDHWSAASISAADTLSISTGKHHIRTGAEIRYYQVNLTRNLLTRGQIDFKDF